MKKRTFEGLRDRVKVEVLEPEAFYKVVEEGMEEYIESYLSDVNNFADEVTNSGRLFFVFYFVNNEEYKKSDKRAWMLVFPDETWEKLWKFHRENGMAQLTRKAITKYLEEKFDDARFSIDIGINSDTNIISADIVITPK